MRGRTAALIAASVVSTGAVAATASAAAGPPAPTGVHGAKVQLFASGLSTPTSFAFGGGNAFEGDGGTESRAAQWRRVPAQERHGDQARPSAPVRRRLGLVQGHPVRERRHAHLADVGEVPDPRLERLERDQLHQEEGDLHRAQEVPGVQRDRDRSGRATLRRGRRRTAQRQRPRALEQVAVPVRHPVDGHARQAPQGVRVRHPPAVAVRVRQGIQAPRSCPPSVRTSRAT